MRREEEEKKKRRREVRLRESEVKVALGRSSSSEKLEG